MPELPEVEVLVRHLAPSLERKKIRGVEVRRARVLGPTSETELVRALTGATFSSVARRGKYLLFEFRRGKGKPSLLAGHLGMTGRMYVSPKSEPLPKHAAVVLDLGGEKFVFEDTRYFGRFTLDTRAVEELGPEPLEMEFSEKYFAAELKRSTQSIKVRLLDQALVAGIGNIYASEALFRARISPRMAARKLSATQVKALRVAIREVLADAIRGGSTLPPDFAGRVGRRDGLFYYGSAKNAPEFYQERLRVYDREGKPCVECGKAVRRLVQAARSTYYCPACQRT